MCKLSGNHLIAEYVSVQEGSWRSLFDTAADVIPTQAADVRKLTLNSKRLLPTSSRMASRIGASFIDARQDSRWTARCRAVTSPCSSPSACVSGLASG